MNFEVQGSTLYKLYERLSMCKQLRRQWNKKVFGDVKDKKWKIQEKLNGLQYRMAKENYPKDLIEEDKR